MSRIKKIGCLILIIVFIVLIGWWTVHTFIASGLNKENKNYIGENDLYEENSLEFDFVQRCDCYNGGLTKLEDGQIGMYYWDYDKLYEVSWSGKEINKSLVNVPRYIEGYTYTTTNEKGEKFYTAFMDKKFYATSSDGKKIFGINENIESYEIDFIKGPNSHFVNDNYVYLLYMDSYYSYSKNEYKYEYEIEKYNLLSGELEEKYSIDNIDYVLYYGENICAINDEKIVVIDLQTVEQIAQIEFEDNRKITKNDNQISYNMSAFSNDSMIYFVDSSGIYTSDIDDGKFKLILDSKDSDFFKKDIYYQSMYVIDENIYLQMGFEWTDYIIEYKKIEP